MIPEAFGHYRVSKSLGGGGMADVYLAYDAGLDRHVAIKAPHPEFMTGEGRARFAREAHAAAALEHYAIVPVYDYSEQGGQPYLVMRHMPGGTLEDRVTGRPIDPAQALPIIERIAAALDYAHSRGVIHRDVKSANILFDDKGNAYLSDFGLAWMATTGESSRLTATGVVRGTFDYISPEQAQGIRDLDGRADLYSLAVVLFEMLTGDVPYRADSALLVAAQHISAPIPDIRSRRPDLPPGVSAVMARALAKRRDDRYPNGAALLADFRRALGGERVPTPRVPTPRPAAPRVATPRPATTTGSPGRRMIWPWIIVAVAALAVAAFALLRPSGPGGAETAGSQLSSTASDAPTTTPEPTSTPAMTETTPPDDDATPVINPIPPQPVVPALSDEIVFQSNRDGDFEIYIMEVDGGNIRQLTDNNVDDNFPRVSADGRRIAFVSERDGNEEIYVMNRDGSAQTRLTADPGRDALPAWSPDGARIVFQSSRDGLMDIFTMDANDGSDLRQITDSLEREGHTSWSPDGERLAYNASMELYWQLYVSDADGANRVKITDSTYDEWAPEWSPDGQWLLFHSERDNRSNPGIYRMRPDGSDAQLIYNGPREEWGASWSADGTQILFGETQPDDSDNLYIMDAGGANVRLLTERGSYPSWAIGQVGSAAGALSPAGEITLSANVARTPTGLMLSAGQPVVIEVVGGGWRAGAGAAWPAVGGGGDPQVASKPVFPVPDRPIMTLVAGVGDGAPFAVGERLVFTATADGELWLGPNDDNTADNDGALTVRVTLDGGARGGGITLAVEPIPLRGDSGEAIRLTFGERDHFTPAFAPDQSRILASARMADGWQIVEIDPNGGGVIRQLTGGANDHYQAVYSPDGQTFLTAADLDGDNDIYLFDAATGEMLQQLTDNPGLDYQPRWLPDGESFIFAVDREGTGNDEIFRGYLDGRQTQLTDNGTYDGFPAVSADGQWIAFYSGRDGDFELYVMDINGGGQRRLTVSEGRDASPSFSPDGQWIVFESDRAGRYEIYAVPFEGGETFRITDAPGDTYFPVISPDGQWLMFQSTRGGYMDVYRQPWAQ